MRGTTHDAALLERAQEFLRTHHVATLATCAAQGPWAAAVFYASAGFELIFVSSPRSRHARDLAGDARVAATVHDNCTDWREIKGIQLEGTARMLEGAQQEHARQIYRARFPAITAIGRANAAIVAAFARVRWYSLVPSRLYLLDNERGFGQRECIELEPHMPDGGHTQGG
ncbi:MAG: pyridoxamine 5'-phosphate oxidase family protein [Burkholderiaceae bacterium]|nr:pyridoxamine 5'-phosphate oxidase family protein [Burkholderiaceae bacterium]